MNLLKKYLFENIHTKQIIFKNAFWLSLSEFFIRGSALFLVILIARFLGVESFGKFSFAITFVQVISILSDMGLSSLIIKDISRENHKINIYIQHIIYLKTAVSISIVILLYPIILLMGLGDDVGMLYAASAYIIAGSFVNTMRSVYKAFERNEYDTKLQLLNGALGIVFVGFLIIQRYSLVTIFLGYALITLMILVIYSYSFKRLYITEKIHFSMETLKEMIYRSGWFFLSSICVYAYYFIDAVLLYFMKGEYAVGIYSASYKILTLLIAPVGIYVTAIFPTLSRSFKEKTISMEIRNMLFSNVKYIFLASLLLLLLLLILSKSIILMLYGETFTESIYILQLLLVSWFILINYSIFAISLQSLDKQKYYFYATFVGMILNIGLNLLLIPRYSVIGSAIATIITELSVGGIICYVFLTQIYRTHFKK